MNAIVSKKFTEKKIVYIDVGTHIGQEYKVLFVYSVWEFLFRFLKIFLASWLFPKNKKNTIGLNEFLLIVDQTKKIRREKKNITTILVEPNIRLHNEKVYRHADNVFCLALGDTDDPLHFSTLFHPDSNKISQGASIFNTNEEIDHSDGDKIIVCGSLPFAEMLKVKLDQELGKNSYEIILRINCEGSEDSAIYGLHKVFKNQFKTILGTLTDVGKIKSSTEMKALLDYIENNGLKFVPFSTLMTTWKLASKEILSLLE